MFEIYVKSKYKQKLLDKLSGDLITKYHIDASILIGGLYLIAAEYKHKYIKMKRHDRNTVRLGCLVMDATTAQFQRSPDFSILDSPV